MNDDFLFTNPETLRKIYRFTQEEIPFIKDLDSLLDKILIEILNITCADAGSIYLLENNKLKFSYVQNNSLFKNDLNKNKYLYSNHQIPVNDKSIAGYAAKTGEILIIDDVYNIDKSLPFSFNKTFDLISSYRTKSILAVPLKTKQGTIVGVIEVINTKNKDGSIGEFNEEQKQITSIFAKEATIAIERAIMTRTIILRMIKISELRDPTETAKHVNRCASYAIEIYDRYAKNKKFPDNEIKNFKDNLRLAAMLHDVGKVAISDNILKKPSKLTDEEFHQMKFHTIAGYQLFNDPTSELDKMSAEVALNHHERWDGKGYPGNFTQTSDYDANYGEGKKGDAIPLSGRIVALVDVFDALSSKRCYKDPWPEDKILNLLKEESGKQFDPEIVSAFLSIYDVIKAIKEKYNE